MKVLLITFFGFFQMSLIWHGNFKEAQAEAQTAHKHILINFSGSDWCGPCIQFRKEVLESKAFENYAKEHLILVRADFPRRTKNRLTDVQIKLNEALAEQYNPDGKFPYTLLIDETGKVLKSWDGYPNESPEKFVRQITDLEPAK